MIAMTQNYFARRLAHRYLKLLLKGEREAADMLLEGLPANVRESLEEVIADISEQIAGGKDYD